MCGGDGRACHQTARFDEIRVYGACLLAGVRMHVCASIGRVAHHCIDSLMGYLVEMYHCSTLPLLYISPIATVRTKPLTPSTTSFTPPPPPTHTHTLQLLELIRNRSQCTHLTALSQLLYKSHLSLHSTHTQSHTAAFNACFRKVQLTSTVTLRLELCMFLDLNPQCQCPHHCPTIYN